MNVIIKKKNVEITPRGFDTRFCCDNHYSYLFELETEKESRKQFRKLPCFICICVCIYPHTYIQQLYSSEKIYWEPCKEKGSGSRKPKRTKRGSERKRKEVIDFQSQLIADFLLLILYLCMILLIVKRLQIRQSFNYLFFRIS